MMRPLFIRLSDKDSEILNEYFMRKHTVIAHFNTSIAKNARLLNRRGIVPSR
jgi:hypothetical protein